VQPPNTCVLNQDWRTIYVQTTFSNILITVTISVILHVQYSTAGVHCSVCMCE